MSLARTLSLIAAAADYRLAPSRQRPPVPATGAALWAIFDGISDERARQALLDVAVSVQAAEAERRRRRLRATDA